MSYLILLPASTVKGRIAHQKLEKVGEEVASLLTQISHACNPFLVPERQFCIKMQTSLFCGLYFVIILERDSCCNTLPSGLGQAVSLLGLMTTAD